MSLPEVPALRVRDVWKPMASWEWIAFWLLLALCCATRLYDLGAKAIMHDEALFVYYTWEQLFKKWEYNYLPILHGPAIFHFQALLFHMFGDSDYTMRLSVALLGIGGFFWIWALRPWLGAAGGALALLFYSLSPGITYYQRFYRNDADFMFATLWIVASLAWWWRTRNGRWLASGVFAAVMLFTNKESSLFVYFSVVTFGVLLIVHDLSAWLLEGKDKHLPTEALFEKLPRVVSSWLPALLLAGAVTLCMTQIFEGLTYKDGETGTIEALGHDWVLRDIRSIPVALGWMELTPAAAPDASPAMTTAGFWRGFYLALFGLSLAASAVLRHCAVRRIGHREVLTQLWIRIHAARWYLAGTCSLGLAWYLYVFTTAFHKPLGVFKIYEITWAYWGGQHEVGRIGGPFHQHTLNMVVYELPAVLAVFAAWTAGLFQAKWTRSTGVVFFLVAIAAAGFHKFVFSGLQYMPEGRPGFEPVGVNYFRHLFVFAAAAGVLAVLVPRLGKMLAAVGVPGLMVFSFTYFGGGWWQELRMRQVFRDGLPVFLNNRHVNLADMMEIQFNFDAGWNLMLVMLLVVFATLHSWHALAAGRRVEAFFCWWAVTSIGAASYAREAVPQVGMHAMLPLILLAASCVGRAFEERGGRRHLLPWMMLIGVAAMWNAKASLALNFRHADDIRERMVYGHTTADMKAHCDFVREYHKIAPVKEGWQRLHNDLPAQKDVRIAVESLEAIWPVRWYLRDLFWRETTDPQTAIDEGWEFLFLKFDADRRIPNLEEKYHVFRGVAIRFWLPEPVRSKVLIDYWKKWIPGHYLDGRAEASQAFEATEEWMRLWGYLWRRQVFKGGQPDRSARAAMSGTDYIFCVRRDLY